MLIIHNNCNINDILYYSTIFVVCLDFCNLISELLRASAITGIYVYKLAYIVNIIYSNQYIIYRCHVQFMYFVEQDIILQQNCENYYNDKYVIIIVLTLG